MLSKFAQVTVDGQYMQPPQSLVMVAYVGWLSNRKYLIFAIDALHSFQVSFGNIPRRTDLNLASQHGHSSRLAYSKG